MKAATLVLFFTFLLVCQSYGQEEVLPSNPISEKVEQNKEELQLLKQRKKEEKAVANAEKDKVKLAKNIESKRKSILNAEDRELKLRRKLTEGNSRGRLSPVDVMKLNRQINKQKSNIERDKMKLARMESKQP